MAMIFLQSKFVTLYQYESPSTWHALGGCHPALSKQPWMTAPAGKRIAVAVGQQVENTMRLQDHDNRAVSAALSYRLVIGVDDTERRIIRKTLSTSGF
jgi:hypothetical protein